MSEYYCKHCDTDYETVQKYNYHQKVKWCSKYKDITFTCELCLYNCKSIKQIEKHNCGKEIQQESIINDNIIYIEQKNQIEQQKNQIEQQKNQIEQQKNQIEQQKNQIEQQKNQIEQQKNQIMTDRIEYELKIKNGYILAKSEIYERIIRNNTDINLDINETTESDIQKSEYIEMNETIIEDDTIDNEISPSVTEINTTSVKEINIAMETRIRAFRTNTSFYNAMNDLKQLRLYLMNIVKYDEFMNILREHLQMYKSVLNLRGYTPHDSDIMITQNALLTIESRMIYHRCYLDVKFDTTELYYYETLCDTLYDYKNNIFNMEKIINVLCNYSTHIWSFKSILRRIFDITTPNIIFVPHTVNKKDDPYNFYILTNVDDTGKKYWKLDNRLSNISESFQDNLLPYLIENFRRIYFDIFNDNIYREDYKNYAEKYDVIHFELKTLCHNILLISNKIKFRKTLCKMIKEDNEYKPSINDIFDIKNDDRIAKDDVNKLDDEFMESLRHSIRNMFDNLTSNNIDKILFKENGI